MIPDMAAGLLCDLERKNPLPSFWGGFFNAKDNPFLVSEIFMLKQEDAYEN